MWIRKGVAALALIGAVAGAQAIGAQSSTYYYCYAYESGGNRLWVSSGLRMVSDDQKTETHNSFVRSVRSQTGASYFAASGCRPPYDNANQGEVQDDRLDFIDRERARGKNVVQVSW